ncbi:hypothetical protein [Marinifilum flexuosum]|uniref:hypothetical protein n=1 Tax=Marinifilum flexuosum TaxID=1117708 RepID=UPI002492ECDC|nr:hypothetical protein [Marinifilum flexuosum]
MKKNRIFFLLMVLLSFSLLVICCEKDDEAHLPDITNTGENTFGCLINGEVWRPEGQILSYPEFSIIHDQYNEVDFLNLVVRESSKSGFRFSIPKDLIKIGEINLKKSFGSEAGVNYTDAYGKEYKWNSENYGEFIVINLDTITNEANVTPYRIIAGTFWFDLVSNEGELIKIREGRFDFKDYSNDYLK